MEKETIKEIFNEVANKYDEIAFFKTSARHVRDIIKGHTSKTTLEVLDVACGTGNVVLECASTMPDATFDAIDISEGMLARAQENASLKKLDNIHFQLQDLTALDLKKKYHVVTCSYVLFFLEDAHKVLAKLISLLRPRGIVIFTSFTAQSFAPANEILLPLLQKYGSSTAQEYDVDKWENLKNKEDIERLCTLAFVTEMEIRTKEIRYSMKIDAWWELLNNTGFKGMLMELSSEDYDKVKSEYYEAMLRYADMNGEVELVADSYFVIAS